MGKNQVRVLVVEDDESLARCYERTIRKLGWSCVCVFSAEEAQHYVHAWNDAPFSAVLLDHALPDGRGLSLVPLLRAASPNIAIFLVSGVLEAAVAVEAAGLHVPIIPKPIDAELLRQLLSAEPVPPADFAHLLSSVNFSDNERTLLTKLAQRSPTWVVTKDLAFALGRHDDAGAMLVWQHVRSLRKKVRRHGFRIESRPGRGGYRLLRMRRRGAAAEARRKGS